MCNQFDRCFFLLDAFEAERVRLLTLEDFDVARSEFDWRGIIAMDGFVVNKFESLSFS